MATLADIAVRWGKRRTGWGGDKDGVQRDAETESVSASVFSYGGEGAPSSRPVPQLLQEETKRCRGAGIQTGGGGYPESQLRQKHKTTDFTTGQMCRKEQHR